LFYRYTQINSNGCYLGPQLVFVEATSPEEAEALAQRAGVYFDGVASARDCACCGDRWTRFADVFATEAEALASVEVWREPEGDGPVYQLVRRADAEGG